MSDPRLTQTEFASYESEFLPMTYLTLHGARQKLAGWHFAKETLTDREREILYVAEAILRELDRRTRG